MNVSRRLLPRLISVPLLVILLSLSPSTVKADDYVKPTLLDLIHMLVRYGAVNLDDVEVMDEYARIAECDLVISYYRDDFKWHDIQKLLRKKLEDGVPTYPTSFYIDLPAQMDRYDFTEKMYKFKENAAPKNANAFSIYANYATCGSKEVVIWPLMYRFVLDRSVTMLGLPIFEDDAKMLLQRMNASGNTDHVIYARYKLRVTRVIPYIRKKTTEGKIWGPLLQDRKDQQIDAQLGSIEFYEDPARTKLVYVYKP